MRRFNISSYLLLQSTINNKHRSFAAAFAEYPNPFASSVYIPEAHRGEFAYAYASGKQ